MPRNQRFRKFLKISIKSSEMTCSMRQAFSSAQPRSAPILTKSSVKTRCRSKMDSAFAFPASVKTICPDRRSTEINPRFFSNPRARETLDLANPNSSLMSTARTAGRLFAGSLKCHRFSLRINYNADETKCKEISEEAAESV